METQILAMSDSDILENVVDVGSKIIILKDWENHQSSFKIVYVLQVHAIIVNVHQSWSKCEGD